MACAIALSFLLFARLAPVAAQEEETGSAPLVYLRDIDASIQQDIRYAGSNNFTGRRVPGYGAAECMLLRDVAEALSRVQQTLSQRQLSLKVYDCYRPTRAVADFAAWARDLNDQRTKAEFYPNVDKSRLFELGYIAERSGHSRGSTLDLTIIDLATGAEIDMGTPFDLFDTRSWPSDQTVSAAAQANRSALQQMMVAHGFRPLREEWWHFTLQNEPHPETYFDFPVRSAH